MFVQQGEDRRWETTLALTNETPTVICVPFVNLIENKITQSLLPEQKYLYPHEIIGVCSQNIDQKEGENLVTFFLREQES